MSERGFSLVQVILLGAVLIGLGLALNSMLSNRAKTDGETERRQRFHDLAEEAGFALRTQSQCAEAWPKLTADHELVVRENLTLAKGAVLPEYGVRIDGITLENIAEESRAGLGIGSTCRVVDVVLSASPLSGRLSLKATRIARVLEYRMSGAGFLADSACRAIEDGEHCPR